MAFEVVMPKWGLSMQEGTIIQWLVQEGAPVAMDEPLLEVETEKMVSVVEAPAAGILGRILHPADSTVPVSEVIAVITEPGEEIPEAPTDAAPAPADAASAEPAGTDCGRSCACNVRLDCRNSACSSSRAWLSSVACAASGAGPRSTPLSVNRISSPGAASPLTTRCCLC